ncbi:hypothetical protein Agub_g13868, partial [Astrephomene gubernaculifera]
YCIISTRFQPTLRSSAARIACFWTVPRVSSHFTSQQTMGRPFIEWLDGRCYACKMCHCNLAAASELLSRQFHSKQGRAYLFNTAVNLLTGPKEERMMTTGLHVVCDVFCSKCMWPVGWRYVMLPLHSPASNLQPPSTAGAGL